MPTAAPVSGPRLRAQVLGAAVAAVAAVASPGGAAAEDRPQPCEGVTVVVDLGVLANADGTGSVGCAPGEEPLTASSALDAAGVGVTGTAQWGAAFVCRVDGRPAADEDVTIPGGGVVRETCARTPSELAYWSVWHAADASAWTYATVGVTELRLAPGDVLGLSFATSGAEPTGPDLSPASARAGDLPSGWAARPASSPGDEPDVTSRPEQDAAPFPVVPVLALVVVGLLVGVAVARGRRP
ncbi:hypothetical protein [Sanguibacter suaedae]|uniref:Secreted protein n=1 Tax=Sanguibacter suaedae TaxID=2795737 RepID=A0A934I280_9MICO|nr:hypothetical protein [Sanguibacter suaedae]MBI9114229.1 hypothetical protein [Sanguibacter suaedae]